MATSGREDMANGLSGKSDRDVESEIRYQRRDSPIEASRSRSRSSKRKRSINTKDDQTLQKGNQTGTNHAFTKMPPRTKRLTITTSQPQDTGTVLHKQMPRSQPSFSSRGALNEALRNRLDPKRTGRLAFTQTDESSKVSQFSEYYAEGGEHLGRYPGRDSYVLQSAQRDGTHWSELLGSDSISADDESHIPENWREGPADYGYKYVADWRLPEFTGLQGVVPGFDDAQGRPDPAWRAAKWVHKVQWVDDEESKHHPVSGLGCCC